MSKFIQTVRSNGEVCRVEYATQIVDEPHADRRDPSADWWCEVRDAGSTVAVDLLGEGTVWASHAPPRIAAQGPDACLKWASDLAEAIAYGVAFAFVNSSGPASGEGARRDWLPIVTLACPFFELKSPLWLCLAEGEAGVTLSWAEAGLCGEGAEVADALVDIRTSIVSAAFEAFDSAKDGEALSREHAVIRSTIRSGLVRKSEGPTP